MEVLAMKYYSSYDTHCQTEMYKHTQNSHKKLKSGIKMPNRSEII